MQHISLLHILRTQSHNPSLLKPLGAFLTTPFLCSDTVDCIPKHHTQNILSSVMHQHILDWVLPLHVTQPLMSPAWASHACPTSRWHTGQIKRLKKGTRGVMRACAHQSPRGGHRTRSPCPLAPHPASSASATHRSPRAPGLFSSRIQIESLRSNVSVCTVNHG